jgi:oligopeptidase B
VDLSPTPPVASRRPHLLVRADGREVDDPWFWLNQRDDPEVIAHLEAENAYTDAVLGPLAGLRDTVFEEIRSRVQESDASAPVLLPGRAGGPAWVYYRRTLAGQQYAIHARRPAPADARDVTDLPDDLRRAVDPERPPVDEVVLLDENVEAAGHDYFRLGAFAVSPDQRLAAAAVDLDGGEIYAVRVRDLATGRVVDDAIIRAATSIAWHDDSCSFLYTVPDDAWRPHQVWRHRVGTAVERDELLLDEPDARYWLGLGRTRSEEFIAIQAGSKVTSEWYLVDAGDPSAQPRLVVPRVQGREVDLDHRGEWLYLVTNADGASDFKLCVAPVDDPAPERWRELVAHRPGIRLEGADAFADLLVLSERTQARTRLRICDPDTGEGELLEMPDEVSTTGLGPNPRFASRVLRCVYTSMVAPTEVLDVDLAGGERTVVKRQEVRGGHDPRDYVTWREWADAPDGTRVPISLVRRADVEGPAPCLLYGYGSYEISVDPAFSIPRLSLLDRGVVFAVAHVRGGGEMGRAWYEQGRLERKPNTFRDFAACADHLVARDITTRERLAIRGGSAGGMLIGAVLNQRPRLCAAAVAEVPFVDVVTTMSDPSIPLTVIEYDEWGDPTEASVHAVMQSYSPYDNVEAGDRPAILATAGLNDPRVQYWEPAKWVARLRDSMTGGGPVLLRIEMGAGHGGRSGRYDAWRDEAEVLAFVLHTTGAA